MELIETAITSVLSGLGGAGITAWTRNRRSKSYDYNKLIELIREDNERLRIENSELRKEVEEIKEQLLSLKGQLGLIGSHHTDSPLPMCLVAPTGEIISANRAYCNLLGASIHNVIGHKHEVVFPANTVRVVEYGNDEVYRNGHAFYSDVITVDGKDLAVRIVKFIRYADANPGLESGSSSFGISIIIIPESESNG